MNDEIYMGAFQNDFFPAGSSQTSSHQREVEALLGSDCMTPLLNHVKGGKMSDDQMKNFVRKLGELSVKDPDTPNILFGNHTTRMSRDKDRSQDKELHQIMSDWWETGLSNITRDTAVVALVKALSHLDVG